MALKKIYIGSFGPSLYDDTDDVDDVDGDFSGKTQQALTTDGAADIEGDLSVGGDLDVTGDAEITGSISADSFALADTDDSHHLSLVWNENSAADYVLNLLVGGGTRSLTLNENFTIGDGSAGTLTFGSACTLTIELSSVLNQDLTTDASPTFANLSLGTGELTAGSINRVSGSLTLEIGGNAVATVAAALVTLAQTLALSDCVNAAADVDKFLVLDASDNVDYRTGAELVSDIGVVTESTTVTAPLVLTDYDISIPAATNAIDGYATAAHITAIEANTEASHAEVHTHDGDTLQLDGINSDGGVFSFTTTGAVAFNQPVRLGEAFTTSVLSIRNTSLSTTTNFQAIYLRQVKTGGATDEADDFWGIDNYLEISDGSTIGNLVGTRNIVVVSDGTIGDGEENLTAVDSTVQMTGGTVNHIVQGLFSVVNLDAGTITGNVYGTRNYVDIESAVTSIGGNVYGDYIYMDVDQAPTGNVYMLYLDEKTGVNFGIYQASANTPGPNYLGGKTSIGGTVTPAAQLHIDQSSTTAAIPVLTLDQGDVSEEMIEFITTIGVGNAIEAVDGKTLTTTHFIKVTIPGPLSVYLPVGTIA